MAKSLLEQLPEIVAAGRKTAERLLESIESRQRVTLQTREVVLPAKDSAVQDWVTSHNRAAQHATVDTQWTNRLIYGDNLLAMAALLAGDEQTPSLRGKVDLIYIDPPFDSKADYRTKVTLPGIELEQKPTVIEQFAYSDTWSDGTASYLAMITPRLILMRELLADTGSIYVHLDWHVGHYVKLVLDEVFFKQNFRNQICWKRSALAASVTTQFRNSHDTIFFYAKSGIVELSEVQYTAYSESSEKHYNKTDGRGVFRTVPLMASGKTNGLSGQPWKGVDVASRGKYGMHWLKTPVELQRLDGEGLVYWNSKGVPELKYYTDEAKGVYVSDFWDDISVINSMGKESVEYQTQKPEKLLERIIRASCPEGGLVADFNGGSGTTAAVAEKLGRRWITTDLGKPACMIMRKRLIDLDAKPFLCKRVGNTR